MTCSERGASRLGFCYALIGGRFDADHQMLGVELKATYTAAQLKGRYEEMTGYRDGVVGFLTLGFMARDLSVCPHPNPPPQAGEGAVCLPPRSAAPSLACGGRLGWGRFSAVASHHSRSA